jgi:hypothetical protein
MNIEHRTSNIQRPMFSHGRCSVGCWVLDAGCWMFLLLVLFPATPRTFGQSGTNALPKLLPPYGPMPPTFWEQHGTNIIIAGIALALLAGSALWRICRPKLPVVVPPEVQAREALAKLQHRPEDGRLLSEVSQVLRRYVGAVFGFPGSEMTTTEFSAAISAHVGIGPQIADGLASFLRACDTDKFIAKNEAPPLNAVRRASQFVEQIERRRQELHARKLSS